MDITIGFTDGAREVSLKAEGTQDDVVAAVTAAMDKGTPTVTLTDDKGRILVAKTATIAWVTVGPQTPHRVGFSIDQ